MKGRATRSATLLTTCAATALAGCAPGPIEAIDLDPSVLLDSTLVAHWSFDDAAGSVLTDQSGHNLNGIITGGTRVTGRFSGGVSFEPTTGSGVSVPTLRDAPGSWSVVGWVRTPGGDSREGYFTIMSTEILPKAATDGMTVIMPGGGWELNLNINQGTMTSYFQFAYWHEPTLSSYIHADSHCCVTLDQWIHVAGVFDLAAHTISFYRNGVVEDSQPAPDLIKPGSETLYFGRFSDSTRELPGALDDFAIYSRALTPREIDYLSRHVVPDPPP